MVNIDIEVEGIVSLFENNGIKEKYARDKLAEFSKEDLINYIIEDNKGEGDNLDEEGAVF